MVLLGVARNAICDIQVMILARYSEQTDNRQHKNDIPI